MGETGYTTFILQYWYVVLTLCLGILAIILFNLVVFIYFSKHQPIEPSKLFDDLQKAHQEEEGEDDDDEETEEEYETEETYHINFHAHHNKAMEYEEAPLPVIPSPILPNIMPVKPYPEPNTAAENSDLNQFRMDAIEAHNDYRIKHQVQPLVYSEELSIYAQYWAETIAKKDKLQHSTMDWRMKFNNEPLGENVILTKGIKLNGKNAAEMWYSESAKHRYQDYQKETSSFSQMVWSGSQLVGFGRAKSHTGTWYGVALYYPEGNILGMYRDNVFPPAQDF